jgi:sortase A
MRRAGRDTLGVTLTLPLGWTHRRRLGRRRLRRAAIAVLLLLGAALLAMGLYLPAKAALAQQLLNRAWVATQRDHDAIARPWPWADTWPVVRLTLPGGHAPLIVLAGASGRNLAFAPTLLDGSAVPGTSGVTVIAGHRDTHFRALQDLAVGDEFTLERPDGETFHYTVAALDVLDSDTESLRLDADDNVVALVTCWPFDAVAPGGSLRYVVTGVPTQSASASRGGHD